MAKEVINTDGTFICDIGFAVQVWIDILHDSSLTNEDRLDVLTKLYYEPAKKSTLANLANIYDEGETDALIAYKNILIQYGESIAARYGLQVQGENGQEDYCYVVTNGILHDDGEIVYQLKSEIVQAMEQSNQLCMLVSSEEQLASNLRTLEKYLSEDGTRDFAIERIHRGAHFIVYSVGGETHFAPSRFIGYVNCSKERYDVGTRGDGKETNKNFRETFGWENEESDDLNAQLEAYCSKLGTTPKNGTHTFFITGISIAPVGNPSSKFSHTYFQCSIKCDDEDWLYAICDEYSVHSMHKDTQHKGVFSSVKPGSIAFLYSKSGLVAYGLVNKVTKKYYNKEIGDWYYLLHVDKWYWHNDKNHKSGVSNYGISRETIAGDQYATIKQITENFALKKMKEINPNTDLYKKIMAEMKMEKYINILNKYHNLVLTGAPGTGKTYLAKSIAEAMNARVGFVQFHPSYDYTDFVEGLRPTSPDENGNIGFVRAGGIFWKFCEEALKAKNMNVTDNFEDSWNKLVEKLNDDSMPYIDVPMLSAKNKTFRIELNTYGTGLATRTRENEDDFDKDNWIKGESKFFSKEQLYNIYRGQKGIPSGGHDNYRRAIIKDMKENFGLKDYVAGQESQSPTKYVFIIDEINRGELSKVFGELFFSIDPGYRGTQGAVKTQYANMHEESNAFDETLHRENEQKYPGNGWFFIPENVYIIGTMNDIDRSVESIDFALRRRFVWQEIKADEMQENMGLSDLALSKMKNLNKAIKSEDIGLNSSYCIGASYFKDSKTESDLQELWELRLEGLLYEYFRGMDDIEDKMNILKEAYK